MASVRHSLLPQILLVFIVIATAARPSDAPWVNDEPIMMEMAVRYNQTASSIYGFHLPFTPCPFGLLGTHGMRYGPLPIWLDQLFLVFTHNPVVMLSIRAFLFSGLTAFAVYLLAKTLKLSPWLAVLTMLSPWIWDFSRSLWDSTWCIPFSAILFAAYARFLAERKTSSLLIVGICCLLLPSIHLMGLAMVVPILLHLLIFHRGEIWRMRFPLAAAGCVFLYLFGPYLFYLFTHFTPENQANAPAARGWIYPIFGGHFFTLGVMGTMPGDGWQDGAPATLRGVVGLCQWISRAALTAVWGGTLLAAMRAWKVIRRRSSLWTDHLSIVAILVWACQAILDVVVRLYYAPHYYSATWIVYAYFAWIAVAWVTPRIGATLSVGLSAIYAASLITGIAIIATVIAQNGGTKNSNYGLSLGNQLAAVREIRKYPADSTLDVSLEPWQRYPLAFTVLMRLTPPANQPRPSARLIVKYRDSYPGDAHITVETLPAQ